MIRIQKDIEDSNRIGVIDADKCKPKKCSFECKKVCPVVMIGKLCIEVNNNSTISKLNEDMCIGCGICVKKCPFHAINIINIPKNLEFQCVHRYGPNTFKLHKLPIPRLGQVLGLVGSNGIGKSTILQILAGRIIPNLGRYDDPPDWSEVINYFRGSELQNYFTKLVNDKLKTVTKLQYVDNITSIISGNVKQILEKVNEMKNMDELIRELDLTNVLDRNINDLSGGELQRLAIAVTCCKDSDVYMFDEPTSYLDVRQRLKAANVIRSLVNNNKYVIVVEHDLSMLDYLSDYICCLYGQPGVYGVVTMPMSTKEGINVFLDGFIPSENLRFRDISLDFKIAETGTELIQKKFNTYEYPQMDKTLDTFMLHMEKGQFSNSEIIVLLGENGTGKTTFIRLLAGLIKPNSGIDIPTFYFSYKPQKIKPKFSGSVRELLHSRIGGILFDPQFQTDVVKPLGIEYFIDQPVLSLSGGELQRTAIILCLGKPADIYLIDEPSAYLDSEQRITVAKVIKRFILHSRKTAFIVEHDFIMSTYVADKIILFNGIPSIKCQSSSPLSLVNGINIFLEELNITFRRDPSNFRPRVNKLNSVKDKEQKEQKQYFYVDMPTK